MLKTLATIALALTAGAAFAGSPYVTITKACSGHLCHRIDLANAKVSIYQQAGDGIWSTAYNELMRQGATRSSVTISPATGMPAWSNVSDVYVSEHLGWFDNVSCKWQAPAGTTGLNHKMLYLKTAHNSCLLSASA